MRRVDAGARGWLLRHVLPPERRAEVLADLAERWERVRAREGERAAARWRGKQVTALTLWALGVRLEGALEGLGEGFRELGSNARVAVRGLARARSYALTAVATLALGIGGTTAVFSVIDGVLLRPLPYAEPHELVAIHETRLGQSWWSAAPANAVAWRERMVGLDDVAWSQGRSVALGSPEGDPEVVSALAVSANYLDLLDMEPLLGSPFEAGADREGAEPVVMLTADAWLRRFAADPAVLGRRLDLDGVAHTVIGVLPRGAAPVFAGAHELLMPRVLTEAELLNRGRVLQAIGRIADGVSLSAAGDELTRLAAELDTEATTDADGWNARLVPLKEQFVGQARAPLFLLLAAVSLVLLVAGANIGNLMLARGSARGGELAIRSSLGAGRGRLVRQLLVEASIIAALGGAAGFAIAVWGTNLILAVDPGALPRLDAVRPDGRLLGFSALASLGAVWVFALVPALRSTAVDLGAVLRGGASGRTTGGGEARLHFALVSAEAGLVLVLLVSATMMLRSVRALADVDPGFQTEERVAARFTVPPSRYPDAESLERLVSGLVEGAGGLPGVRAAGTISTLPLTGQPGYTSFHVVRSLPVPEPGAEPIGGIEVVSPGYFEAMGIPILAGRDFSGGESVDGADVVIVDRAMVERFWPETDPLDDAVRIAPESAGPVAAWKRVVGVVESVHYGLGADRRPRLYVPQGGGPPFRTRTLVVRVEPGAPDVAAGLRETLEGLDAAVPFQSIRSLDEIARASIARPRLQGMLLTIFAAVGLGLGAVGVYGVVSYAVGRRTREMGVRLALGASRSAVLGDVVRDALRPVTVGLAVGLAGAAALSRVLVTVMYGVAPLDPVSFGSAPLLLLAVAAGAALLPGWRAARTDPVDALREE